MTTFVTTNRIRYSTPINACPVLFYLTIYPTLYGALANITLQTNTIYKN